MKPSKESMYGISEVPEEERGKVKEGLLREIMVENFWNPGTDMEIQVHMSWCLRGHYLNPKWSSLRCIIINLQKQRKRENPKSGKEKEDCNL